MANSVASFDDGVGNRVDAIQWDGDPGTLANILAWTRRARVDSRGLLGIQFSINVRYVNLTNWVVMDSNRFAQAFPMPAAQFAATYRPIDTPPP